MTCTCCGSRDSVQPFDLAVFGVGLLRLILCRRCRLQLQVQVWKDTPKAA